MAAKQRAAQARVFDEVRNRRKLTAAGLSRLPPPVLAAYVADVLPGKSVPLDGLADAAKTYAAERQ